MRPKPGTSLAQLAGSDTPGLSIAVTRTVLAADRRIVGEVGDEIAERVGPAVQRAGL
jgi:hypothetical protein